MNPIPYGRQTITDEDIAAVTAALKSDYLTQGPRISEFEQAFSRYIGCKFSVAVANGTAALHLAALALGAKAGQKAITSPITFAATANCLRYCDAEPVFVDIDPDTFLLDLNKLRDLLKRSKANEYSGVLPVDFAGLPVRLDELASIAEEFGLWILEDACHAPGGGFRGKENWNCGDGLFADAAIFSFHPVKHIACGEGGMITTNRKDIYETLIRLRTHGITKDPSQMIENHGGWYMGIEERGFNYRLTDFQAALGLSQLNRASAGMLRRKEIAKKYDMAFADAKIKFQKTPAGSNHAYHLYVIEVNNRLELYNKLKEKNILAQIHYLPVHMHPYYRNRGWKRGDLPNAERYYERCISLPIFPALTDAEQDLVIMEVIKNAK